MLGEAPSGSLGGEIPRQNRSDSTSSFATAKWMRKGYRAAAATAVSLAVFPHELVVSLADFENATVDPSSVSDGASLARDGFRTILSAGGAVRMEGTGPCRVESRVI